MPWLMGLVACRSLRRHVFDPTGFMVDIVTLGWDFLRELQVPVVFIILDSYSSISCSYENVRLPEAIFFGNRGALDRNVLSFLFSSPSFWCLKIITFFFTESSTCSFYRL